MLIDFIIFEKGLEPVDSYEKCPFFFAFCSELTNFPASSKKKRKVLLKSPRTDDLQQMDTSFSLPYFV